MEANDDAWQIPIGARPGAEEAVQQILELDQMAAAALKKREEAVIRLAQAPGFGVDRFRRRPGSLPGPEYARAETDPRSRKYGAK